LALAADEGCRHGFGAASRDVCVTTSRDALVGTLLPHPTLTPHGIHVQRCWSVALPTPPSPLFPPPGIQITWLLIC
jgi:hypothetical protein